MRGGEGAAADLRIISGSEKQLVAVVQEERSWSDLGLDLFRTVLVATTNPAQSNSGIDFAGIPPTIDSVIPMPSPTVMTASPTPYREGMAARKEIADVRSGR